MRVALLAGTLGQGGAERQLYYMATALASSGVALEVIAFSRGEYWEGKLRSAGIPVTSMEAYRSRPRRINALSAILRRRFDLVHSQHFYTNLYAVVAGKLAKMPAIGSLRSDVVTEMADVGGIAGWLSLRLPRMVVANSRPAVRKAAELGVPEKRLRLLPNVVDTERFRPAARCDNGVLRILAAGRFVGQKRFDRLLSVAAALRDQQFPFRLSIVGDGPLRDELVSQRDRFGLHEAVSFLGSHPDMAPLYQAADVFVLTSDHEGTPNVVLEAMASGLPVIATRVGGVPDLIADGRSGLLCDTEDELAGAIVRLGSDRDRMLDFGRCSREIAEREYAVDRLPETLRQIYSAVLN